MNQAYRTLETFTDKYQKEGWLIMHGGADISPSIYGKKNYKSFASEVPSRNDLEQMEQIREAVKKGIPIIANCRTQK